MLTEQIKLKVKIFPAAGLWDQKRELEIELNESSLIELMAILDKRLNVNQEKMKRLMFLHNGRALDRSKDVVFNNGDQLWLLPLLSGG